MAAQVAEGALTRLSRSAYGDTGATLRAQLIDFAKTVPKLEGVDEEAKKRTMGALLKVMETSLETRQQIDGFLGALDSTKADIAQGRIDLTADEPADLDAIIKTKLAAAPKRSLARQEEYGKLRKLAKPLLGSGGGGDDGGGGSDDDDCEVEEEDDTVASLRCPITTALLVDPMRSKKCGHTFSKASLQIFRGPVGTRCAHVGCNKVLRQADFESDKEKALAVKRLRQREELQRKATQSMADEEVF